MKDLLVQKYNDVESLKGRRLVITLVSVFFAFIFLGVALGFLMSPSKPQQQPIPKPVPEVNKDDRETLGGVIVYVDPITYPGEDIKYLLTTPDGKEIIPLTAYDNKLDIVEGMNVNAIGKRKTTDSGYEVFVVEEVKINAAN